VDSLISSLPPREGQILYIAQVDPHLIGGCEVVLDVDLSSLKLLCDVQHKFLRRLLGVNPSSPLAPLFTELGILPLRFRRIALALCYLAYLVSLPNTHFAHAALCDSMNLHANGSQGWFMDLDWALRNVTADIALLNTGHIPPELVDSLIKSVHKCAASWLDSEIESSVCLHLLHGHLEPVEDKPPRKVIISFRHYLEVPIPKHRLALTRLVLADHPLAVEQLRRASRYHPPVPCDDRLCRLSKQHVETPEHVLVPALCDLQHNFA
jgi:hypothetical protein